MTTTAIKGVAWAGCLPFARLGLMASEGIGYGKSCALINDLLPAKRNRNRIMEVRIWLDLGFPALDGSAFAAR